MKNTDLGTLGQQVAALRIKRRLKQTELAYEAGVSHRTLQRLEAGEVVKTDVLLKVLRALERLEQVLGALESSDFSPYERLAESGLKISELERQNSLAGRGDSRAPSVKRRVRRSAAQSEAPNAHTGKAVKVQWPEDQQ